MVKNFLVLIAAMGFAVPAWGQEYGALLGVHQTTADSDVTGTSVDGKLNFKAGLLVGFELVEKTKFRSGLLYTQRHFETKAGNVESKVNFDYFDIPANVQYNFNEMFGVFGGLTFAINTNDKVKQNVGNAADPDADKLIPLLDLGVNLLFSDMIGFDFYYQRGMGGFAKSLENYSTFGGSFIYWF